MQANSIPELFRQVTSDHAAEVGYRARRGDDWIDVTWAEHGETAAAIARSLLALGVERGDRVCILGKTRLKWVQADIGILFAGGVTVGIYPSNLAPECAYIVNHSGSRVIFVEDASQLEKILAERESLDLRWIVRFEGDSDPDRQILSWDDFLRRGETVDDAKRVAVAGSLGPDDLASIVYTSGTTGVPKGVMISHRNILFSANAVGQCLPVKAGHVSLLFLPLAHVYARMIVMMLMSRGATVAFAEDLANLSRDFKEVRPHFIASVPRIYEKTRERVLASVETASPLKQRLFHWALGVGDELGRYRLRREQPPLGLRLRHAVANRLVLSKVLEAFGGRMSFAISGAAPLDLAVAEFFHACGLTLLEGIGMTENTSISNVNRIDAYKFGSVGPVVPGVEMKLAEDGEILFRGDNVMVGYYENPEATAETIDAEGWLHSGDVGQIDQDGHLIITDRKKDLIITAGGKNIAPQRIEDILRRSPFISNAMAFGDRRKYITALIAIDAARIRKWAKEQGLTAVGEQELAGHAKVREMIGDEIKQLNEDLASYETVKRFHIVPQDFSIEEGDLTPTLKLRRKAITAKYSDRLDELYDS